MSSLEKINLFLGVFCSFVCFNFFCFCLVSLESKFSQSKFSLEKSLASKSQIPDFIRTQWQVKLPFKKCTCVSLSGDYHSFYLLSLYPEAKIIAKIISYGNLFCFQYSKEFKLTHWWQKTWKCTSLTSFPLYLSLIRMIP